MSFKPTTDRVKCMRSLPVASDEGRISCRCIDALQYISIPYVRHNCIYRKE